METHDSVGAVWEETQPQSWSDKADYLFTAEVQQNKSRMYLKF